MKVRQLMTKELFTVPPTANLFDAALMMKDKGIGCVLIADGDRTKGIVTDRDISLAVAAELKDPKKTLCTDIIKKMPVTILVDADIDYALKVMNDENVRRLPVYDKTKLVGMLSSADIAMELREEFSNFMGLEEAFVKHHS
jgi:CBS domain-containing protein